MSENVFCVAVTFLNGRYHGEEWPPSPARLYQALVAGAMGCGHGATDAGAALRWLETLGPPRIVSSWAARESAHRLAVPNNDMDAIAREWIRGRAANPSAIRTMKTVRAWRTEGDGPHVRYYWTVPEGEAAVGLLEKLRAATERLHTLGWGVDMAFADLRPDGGAGPDGHVTHEPVEQGGEVRLEVPMEGTLEDLEAVYERFQARTAGKGVDAFTRPSMLRLQRYQRPGAAGRAFAAFRIVPEGGRYPSWGSAMMVAAWLRHGASVALAGEIEHERIVSVVLGHGEERGEQLSYVPIPSIGPPHGDGSIRRCVIVEPPGGAGEIAWLAGQKLAGAALTDSSGRRVCTLEAARVDGVFERFTPRREAARWRSVTPVVLHGHNATRGEISVAKTERMLLRAFQMAGYEERGIEALAFQRAPFWAGSQGASAMRAPAHLDGLPRVHVEVRFREAVRGPVLAGLGRHYGIGVFAAVREG